MLVLSRIYRLLTTPPEPKDGEIFASLPLTGAVLPVLLICFSYLYFVLKCGPQWMKNRQPFELKKLIMIYNMVQIAFNAVLFIGCCYLFYAAVEETSFTCLHKLRLDHSLKWVEVYLCYGYYILKIFDFIDTIFFVLRKSFKQITFLHVYHHVLLVLANYIYIYGYGYGGHSALIGIPNTLVHVVMYAYYLQSTLRPKNANALWWKKYITILQLVQFVLVFINQSLPLLLVADCTYPKYWCMIGMTQALVFIYLFGKFYKNAYLQQKPKEITKTQ